jgi:hypothetical protein
MKNRLTQGLGNTEETPLGFAQQYSHVGQRRRIASSCKTVVIAKAGLWWPVENLNLHSATVEAANKLAFPEG